MSPSIFPVRGPVDARRGQLAFEPICRVILQNDDQIPMVFVARILMTIFRPPAANALTTMYSAHLAGQAFVLSLPRPEAGRRIGSAQFAARMMGLPQQLAMEPE